MKYKKFICVNECLIFKSILLIFFHCNSKQKSLFNPLSISRFKTSPNLKLILSLNSCFRIDQLLPLALNIGSGWENPHGTPEGRKEGSVSQR